MNTGKRCSWCPATWSAAATTKGQGGESFTGPTYCVRPPGVYHGPFTSKTGCLLLETHYYVPK